MEAEVPSLSSRWAMKLGLPAFRLASELTSGKQVITPETSKVTDDHSVSVAEMSS